MTYLRDHAKDYSGEEFSFVGRDGKRMRVNTVHQAFVRARDKIGVSLAFHDLRHTGLAVATGANLVDLHKRPGHSTTAAGQRHLHTVEGRRTKIADALSQMVEHGDAATLPDRLA